MLQSTGSQIVRYNSVTEQQQKTKINRLKMTELKDRKMLAS